MYHSYRYHSTTSTLPHVTLAHVIDAVHPSTPLETGTLEQTSLSIYVLTILLDSEVPVCGSGSRAGKLLFPRRLCGEQ